MPPATIPLTIRLITSTPFSPCVSVPRSLANALISRASHKATSFPTVLELIPTSAVSSPSPAQIFVGWSGDIVLDDRLAILELGSDLGMSFNLIDGAQVYVSVVKDVPVATRVYLQPTTPDDWDVVYLHASALELILLKTMPLVIPNLAIRLHLPAPINSLINVTIERIEVNKDLIDPPCAFLTEGSEVAIAPAIREKSGSNPPVPQILRLVYSSNLPGMCQEESEADAFIHSADWQKLVMHLDSSHHSTRKTASIQLLVPPLVTPILLQNKNQVNRHVEPAPLDLVDQPCIYFNILPLPSNLENLPQGHLFVTRPELFNLIRGAILYLKSDLSGQSTGSFKSGVDIHGLGWSAKCMIATAENVSPSEHNACLPFVSAPPLQSLLPAHPISDPLDVLVRIKSWFTTGPTRVPLTITGGMKTGKTTFSQSWLSSILDDTSTSVWTPIYITLDQWIAPMSLYLAQVAISDLCRVIEAVSPVALVLDGLDFVVSSDSGPEEDQSTQRAGIISRWIVSGLQHLIDAGLTRVIVCVRDIDGVHPIFRRARWVADRPRGSKLHALDANSHRLIVLGEGGSDERRGVLQAHLNTPKYRHNLSAVDLNEIAALTDGYNALDLQHIISQAYHQSISSQPRNCDPIITFTFLKDALASYIPASLTTLKSSTSKSNEESGNLIRLDQLGGLSRAKEILIETLVWPTKYPDLYAQVPIRIRQGVLLYGYPGVGKTALANTLTRHYNLRTIVIKGPELLNKYIGASEAGVRRVFAQARAAAPCVLFLDELDALAPRRGSDHAGVTDRVVNQLLTELDGAESMGVGVYVIGATSRPDLVDPALLRPGRLDKPIFCNMPNQSERLEILQVVVQGIKMPLSDDIAWEQLAAFTEGYTGADIHALMYNTSLEAMQDKLLPEEEVGKCVSARVHDQLEYRIVSSKTNCIQSIDRLTIAGMVQSDMGPQAESSKEEPVAIEMLPTITQAHFLSALSTTRPSVSVELYKQLKAIYDTFSHRKQPSGPVPADKKQKLTLK